jgi:glutathione S-transferase|tara:strand:- start:345 stop:1028 length:684 start_codon:yes stop_codon:yes gene_type:complete
MLKLNYFNGKGMCETSRLILVAVGKKFEDYRYPIKINDWATYDIERKEFDEDKASGKLVKSMGKVPFLNVGDGVISQSKAIERYLARRFKIMGETFEEGALIDSYCEYIRDFKTAYQAVKRKENREEAMKEWFGLTLPQKLVEFDKLIYENIDFQNMITPLPRQFAVGNKLSLADIVIYSFLTDFFDDKESVRSACSNCNVLKAIVKDVGEIPQIKKWVENREDTAF